MVLNTDGMAHDVAQSTTLRGRFLRRPGETNPFDVAANPTVSFSPRGPSLAGVANEGDSAVGGCPGSNAFGTLLKVLKIGDTRGTKWAFGSFYR